MRSGLPPFSNQGLLVLGIRHRLAVTKKDLTERNIIRDAGERHSPTPCFEMRLRCANCGSVPYVLTPGRRIFATTTS